MKEGIKDYQKYHSEDSVNKLYQVDSVSQTLAINFVEYGVQCASTYPHYLGVCVCVCVKYLLGAFRLKALRIHSVQV